MSTRLRIGPVRRSAQLSPAVVLLFVATLPFMTRIHAETHAARHDSVLVFSKTEGFRHSSIPDGILAIQQLGSENNFDVVATEDASVFVDSVLAHYSAVVFLNTTADVLDDTRQGAFERYIRAGGGFVGVHAAADTEYNWPFYADLIGAHFESHPATQPGTINVVDRVHPATSHLPARWERTDEWYNFQINPRGDVHVLATLDESTYSGGNMGFDHPIAWCHVHEGGRSWYTGLGHTPETYAEPFFRTHLLNGILWATGDVEGDCGATIGSNFQKVILDADVSNPLDLVVAPDGRVLFIELDGNVKVFDPVTGVTSVAATLAVEAINENGLIGIAMDPSFESNNWIYLLYTPSGGNEIQRLSRFTLAGNTLDLASERIMLEFGIDRSSCCHAGGGMVFDDDGNLFIALGDDTNPFDSDGFAPIDTSPGREVWDAQRTAANTNDLRGKILRIRPESDGTYSIPAGNLFPSDGSAGRPEIYVMGVRNPFRLSVDTDTGWLYWGDVGPDSPNANVQRGPAGLDEWNQARGPGNYGWPHCIGPNEAYIEYDFATGQSGSPFDCAAPTNESPNNTGETTLPVAEPAWIWYPYGASSNFPAITDGPGRTGMAGPVYQFELASGTARLPAYYDNTLFIYEWSRNWIHEVKLDDNGDLLAIHPFAPEIEVTRPIAMTAGPDGALYVIEWGSGFGGNNADAQVVRIEYVLGSRAPIAIASATPTSGPVPLSVSFSATGSYDPDPGDALLFEWDFDGDGVADDVGTDVTHTYGVKGVFSAILSVTDLDDNKSTSVLTITAGNSAPTVTVEGPVEGGFYAWGDQFAFSVVVTDAEDGSTTAGTIDCDDVTVQAFIGHDDHSHPLDSIQGCEGIIQTVDGHGDEGANVFYLVEARYTDSGSGVTPLTERDIHRLNPRRLEAEHFTVNGGTIVEATSDWAGGVSNIGFIDHGDYVGFHGLNLANIGFVTYRVASAGLGGQIEVRADGPSGTLLSTTAVDPTGGWQQYEDVTASIDDPGGATDLYFVFTRNPGDGGLFNLNWITFHGTGISEPTERGPEGLSATYYSQLDFMGRTHERTDPQIGFNWGDAGPVPLFANDTFSVRWEGSVRALLSDTHTFTVRSDDGARFWFDGALLIDRWQDQSFTSVDAPPVVLEAGVVYPIVLEYYNNVGRARMDLQWSSRTMPQSTVPAAQLYPKGAVVGLDPVTAEETELSLNAPFPNPVRGTAKVTFDLPTADRVRLEVFDLLGRRVLFLVDGERAAGHHVVDLDGARLAAGTYVCRLTTSSDVENRSLVVVR